MTRAGSRRLRRIATGGAVLAAAVLGTSSAQPPAAGSDFRPAASIAEIMQSIVVPASNALWQAGAEDAPTSDEGWQSLRASAVTLAESANSLLIPGRAANVPGATPEYPDAELAPAEIEALIASQWPAWAAFSQVLHEAAMQAVRGVDTEDIDAVIAAGDTLYGACEGCHKQFWFPE